MSDLPDDLGIPMKPARPAGQQASVAPLGRNPAPVPPRTPEAARQGGETTRPAARTLRAQQYRLETFRRRYNDERPHEAIGDRTPSSLWKPSTREYPERIAQPVYPAHVEVRRVSSAGTFRLHAQQPFLSQVLRGEDIGLEEVGDGIWNIVYYSNLLGKIDERSLHITGTA